MVASHRLSGTRVYHIWENMKRRGTGKMHCEYYHDRGIGICEDWLTFANFYRDMGDPPTDKHTIDRINNDLGYSPANCRWATRKEQTYNTRVPVAFLTFRGLTLSECQWAKKVGLQPSLLHHRLEAGWSIENALTKPVGWGREQPRGPYKAGKNFIEVNIRGVSYPSLREACRKLKISYKSVDKQRSKGLTPEDAIERCLVHGLGILK